MARHAIGAFLEIDVAGVKMRGRRAAFRKNKWHMRVYKARRAFRTERGGAAVSYTHLKGIVPAFLGGSFAFIAPLTMIITDMGIPYAQGGLVFVMCFYFLFALLLKLLGTERINRVFPPVITGPIIICLLYTSHKYRHCIGSAFRRNRPNHGTTHRGAGTNTKTYWSRCSHEACQPSQDTDPP